MNILDGYRYSKLLKEFSNTRPHPSDSLWNSTLNGNFLVEKVISKEDDTMMKATGELGVCRAAISYALRVAAMGSFPEASITDREREKTETAQELAKVGGIEGLVSR